MRKPEIQLRLYQITCILLVVACVYLSGVDRREAHSTMTLVQWLIVLAAIYSAVSGFTLQRRIVRVRNPSLRSNLRSTPLSRWKAGHLLRLACATSAGLWAYLLHLFDGPDRLVYVLFGIGLLLLLIWQPGTYPPQNES